MALPNHERVKDHSEHRGNQWISTEQDENSNSAIPMQEVGTILWSLGPNPTKAELQKVVGKLDCDSRGPIGFPELLGLMAWKVKAGDSEDHIWEAFCVFDKDSKVLINTIEQRHAMTWLGKKLNNQEVEEITWAARMDADGQVNWEEFMHLLVLSFRALHGDLWGQGRNAAGVGKTSWSYCGCASYAQRLGGRRVIGQLGHLLATLPTCRGRNKDAG
ncbi:uncharacterized protein LOC129554732 [Moschus berezovskii]|uniref:uncharacterized protein LOC129554732 n=1 Tax=Moschus berezovskii TaxID=68408 RepID=UPI002443A160|nr:uncharacterized protein LOC129554732 [Moschus berezovskii]